MARLQSHNGSCHCGNVRFEFATRVEPSRLGARRCGCTFCQKHAGVWTSDPNGSLRVWVADSSALTRYTIGTKTAEFYVCATCGVVPLAVSDIEGTLHAVVCINALDDRSAFSLSESPSDFSGENTEGRLERRKMNWIADVTIIDASD